MALTKLEEIIEDNLDYKFVEQGAIPSIKVCCRIYAQSQTQELKEQNAELVCIIYTMVDEFENTSKSSSDILMDALKKTKELLTKYNHLNKKP